MPPAFEGELEVQQDHFCEGCGSALSPLSRHRTCNRCRQLRRLLESGGGPGLMTTQVIYLLHFDRPFGHARHCMGSAVDLELRLADHRNGQGARLMFWVVRAGIGWRLARTWVGGRQRGREAGQFGDLEGAQPQ